MIALKINQRQLRTLFCMLAITTICWPLVNYHEYFIIFPPFLFASGLIYTNLDYLRYKISPFIIVILFLFIYTYGTLPFYQNALAINSNYLSLITGCIGTFLLAVLTIKLVYRAIRIDVRQIIITTTLAVTCATVIEILDTSFNIYTDAKNQPGVIIAIYQLFMSLSIASIMVYEYPDLRNH